MISRSTRTYSNISGILARKAEGRRELASRSFAEKIECSNYVRSAPNTEIYSDPN